MKAFPLPSALIITIFSFNPLAASAQTPVRTASVKREVMQQRHRVTGSLRAVSRGDLAALEAGRLIELTARAGDQVAKGDPLARIDSRRLDAQKREALADKRVAEADLKSSVALAEKAAADYARSEKLIQANAGESLRAGSASCSGARRQRQY